jgi:hypothetical protein
MTRRLAFFLGGHDLEMLTIRDLLREVNAGPVYDRRLGWGAHASAYHDEISGALAAGWTPVLVELEDDLGLSFDSAILIDHHGERAGGTQPTSLHQVFDLLELPAQRWTHWFDLVAANDRGYLAELSAIGATQEEIQNIRQQDRHAQGVTTDQEVAAAKAANGVQTVANGRLSIARLTHNRTSPLVDRLQPELGGPGFQNLFVICPDEVAFFGEGALVDWLDTQFPNGWYGGALPERGFWGRASGGSPRSTS